MSSLLPFLLILACPLTMIFMMRGMGHGSHAGPRAVKGGPDQAALREETEGSSAAELHSMHAELEARIEELTARMDELEQSEARGTRGTAMSA